MDSVPGWATIAPQSLPLAQLFVASGTFAAPRDARASRVVALPLDEVRDRIRSVLPPPGYSLQGEAEREFDLMSTGRRFGHGVETLRITFEQVLGGTRVTVADFAGAPVGGRLSDRVAAVCRMLSDAFADPR